MYFSPPKPLDRSPPSGVLSFGSAPARCLDLDRVTTGFAYIYRLGKRSAVPDDFSHARIDRDRLPVLWAERIQGYLARGVSVFVFVLVINHYQGHGPATARALLSPLAAPVFVP